MLLSRASVSSLWVKRELNYALTKSRYKERIVPVLLENCNFESSLSWTLSTTQIVTMKKLSRSTFARLLQVWEITYDAKKLKR